MRSDFSDRESLSGYSLEFSAVFGFSVVFPSFGLGSSGSRAGTDEASGVGELMSNRYREGRRE